MKYRILKLTNGKYVVQEQHFEPRFKEIYTFPKLKFFKKLIEDGMEEVWETLCEKGFTTISNPFLDYHTKAKEYKTIKEGKEAIKRFKEGAKIVYKDYKNEILRKKNKERI
jgi:hypothetical protein